MDQLLDVCLDKHERERKIAMIQNKQQQINLMYSVYYVILSEA